ncbi:MAG: hypothetical protein K8R63_13520 [Bacteroidales bacterium]|nr:hypothetical protein [Bacteroidales bacterium]
MVKEAKYNKPTFDELFTAQNIVGFVFSPILLVTTIKEFRNAFEFIGNNYILSISIILCYIILVLATLYSIVRKGKKDERAIKPIKKKSVPIESKPSSLRVFQEETTIEHEQPKRAKSWIFSKLIKIVSVIFILLSLSVAVYLFFLTSNGLYYPIIASIDKNIVNEEVAKMNNYILEKGYDDLKLRVYCKKGQDVCSVVPGGVHFSMESAEETIENAKKLIPQYTDSDGAWVLSYTVKETFFNKIKKWFE